MNIMNDEIKLEFNVNLYSYESIILAAEEFTKNFWVAIDKLDNKITVYLKPKPEIIGDIDMNRLGCEFYNYALGLMQSHQTTKLITN